MKCGNSASFESAAMISVPATKFKMSITSLSWHEPDVGDLGKSKIV